VGPSGLVYAADRLGALDVDGVYCVVTAIRRAKAGKCIPSLRKQLQHPNPQALATIVDLLKVMDAKEAVPDLLPLLNHGMADVQAGAIEALLSLGDGRCVQALAPSIVSPTGKCGKRPQARGTREEAESAIRGLAGRRIRDPNRQAAGLGHGRAGLGSAGPPEAASALGGLLESRFVEVRTEAVSALGTLKSQDANGRLHVLLRDDTEAMVRQAVAGALLAIGSRQSVPPLIDALQVESDPQIQKTIVNTLQRMTQARIGLSAEEWKAWLNAHPNFLD